MSEIGSITSLGHYSELENIIARRKAKYLLFIQQITTYPIRCREDRILPPTNYKVNHGAKRGLIPWISNRMSPDQFIEKEEEKIQKYPGQSYGPHAEYFYTNFFSTAPELILLDENEIRDFHKSMSKPADVSHLPQDGSRGQAHAARRMKRDTAEWFLGMWHGFWNWEEDCMREEEKEEPEQSETDDNLPF